MKDLKKNQCTIQKDPKVFLRIKTHRLRYPNAAQKTTSCCQSTKTVTRNN